MATIRDWAPRTEQLTERLDAGPARRMHALFDSPGSVPAEGDELPALWHWLYFLPAAPQAVLGPDGHPRTGAFLPPAPYPRRMFAASTVTVEEPLRLGDLVSRRAVASAPETKQGRSGSLAFVTVDYTYEGAQSGRVRERQTLVYRPVEGSPARPTADPLPEGPWTIDLMADERLLFRFSALTYNAHRIHYDLDYARREEGYPGLVVQGPLLAMGLAEVVRRYAPRQRISRFGFRAVRPAFAPTSLRLVGSPSPDGSSADLVSADSEGVVLRADVEWRR